MVISRTTAFALLFAVPLLLTAPAHADVAPVNRCTEEGAECANGLPDSSSPWSGGGFAPGICTKKTCSRATPEGGENGVVHYDCLLCIAKPGQGGSPGAGGSSGSPAAGTAGALSGGSDDGCSCRVPGGAKPWTLAGAMLAVGAVALAGSRRRRR